MPTSATQRCHRLQASTAQPLPTSALPIAPPRHRHRLVKRHANQAPPDPPAHSLPTRCSASCSCGALSRKLQGTDAALCCASSARPHL